MKRIWMLIGKSSRCKWASSHLSSCPRCPRPAAREKPVVRQLRNEWSPTGHAALNVYIILDNAHIVQRTVIEIPKIYLRRVLSKEYGMDAILFFSQHPLSCRITFSPLKGWTNILLKTDLCSKDVLMDDYQTIWVANQEKPRLVAAYWVKWIRLIVPPLALGTGCLWYFSRSFLNWFSISVFRTALYIDDLRCVGGGVFTQVNPAQWTLWAVFVSPDSGNGRFLRGELLQQWSVTSTLKVPSDITTFAFNCAAFIIWYYM